MKTGHCLLCSCPRSVSIGEELISGVSFTVVRCSRCSLIYIQGGYSPISPQYVMLNEQDIDAEYIWRQTKHKELAFRMCLKEVRRFQLYTPNSAVRYLLDVGCGIGGWMDAARGQYECYGFDASPAQSNYARQRFPNVRCSSSLSEYRTCFDGHLPYFDLITLWDVLEHLRHPLDFMMELAPALSPTGVLFASVPAATPMIVKNWLLSYGWPKSRFSWSPTEHVAYYSPKTLRLLCQKSKLEVVRMGSVDIYHRALSPFELLRRFAFAMTRPLPSLSPQIYVLAKSNASR